MSSVADSKQREWAPDSWTGKAAIQQATYADSAHLQSAFEKLQSLPPLVTSWEVESLREQIALAQDGGAFVLQGGDCSESFEECTSENIVRKLKILLQMSFVLSAGLHCPVVRVGRMAGQYAKPRSADTETRADTTLPSYRGDLVNGLPFTAESREPNPDRLLRGYELAAMSLNFIRSLIDGGFADLHHPENWDLDFVGHSTSSEQYHRVVQRIADGLEFYEAYAGAKIHESRRVEFFTSHEGLHLLYEQAQTRFLPHRQSWYNLTTHTPWIGMRTADPNGAHVEYFRGIENPIGIKVGSKLETPALQQLLEELNPKKTPGRITLIHRFGAANVAAQLPPIIDAVAQMNTPVLWMSDPMHGNTETVASGVKTRRLENILAELDTAAQIHLAKGSHLGGVHLELTGEHVTECTGGARGLADGDLDKAYRTQVDPRLNYEQAMEVAFTIAGQSTRKR